MAKYRAVIIREDYEVSYFESILVFEQGIAGTTVAEYRGPATGKRKPYTSGDQDLIERARSLYDGEPTVTSGVQKIYSGTI